MTKTAPTNPLKAALKRGEAQCGLWMSSASALVAEVARDSAFDWYLLDGEHGPNTLTSLQQQIAALGPNSNVVTRVPQGETWLIKQVLDMGIQNLLVPMIHTAEMAADVVSACRYPPHGLRGVGAAQARATNYGRRTNYMPTAADELCVMVQIESAEAVSNIDAIAGTDGVDVVFVGPADLAADMGHLGNITHPDVVAAIDHCFTQILAAGKAAGIVTFNTQNIAPFLAQGVTFLGVGGDIATMAKAYDTLAATANEAKNNI
ncbi:MAG: HpcH/HpaI aldolase/citrate lyase family protein [Pseudomonadota bacterium]